LIGAKEEEFTEVMLLVHVRENELIVRVALLTNFQDLQLYHTIVDLAKFKFDDLSLVVREEFGG